MSLKSLINTYPDFPKKGIQFKDVTPILRDHVAFHEQFIQPSIGFLLENHLEIDFVVGIESRGFWFGMPLACYMSKGFIPVRKSGKLPGYIVRKEYSSEYKTDLLELQQSNLDGFRILIVDDILATGETALTAAKLIELCKGKVVGILFVGEIKKLKGREKLNKYKVHSLVNL